MTGTLSLCHSGCVAARRREYRRGLQPPTMDVAEIWTAPSAGTGFSLHRLVRYAFTVVKELG